MRFENTVVIDAPVDTVWDMTIDVARWPSITPTMTQVQRLDDGPMRVGSQARIKQPGQTEAVWTVTRLTDGREFTWQTKRLGLTMTGSHHLEPVGTGTRNTLTLDVEGRGSAVFGRLFGRVMRNAIATENAGFRAAAAAR
jgi:uncharacterized membrane protein